MLMCEPLRGKRKVTSDTYDDGQYDGVDIIKADDGNLFKFEDVKSAVEFYKKYENMNLLGIEAEQPEMFKLFSKECQDKRGCIRWYSWQTWLFKYCFGDVTE